MEKKGEHLRHFIKILVCLFCLSSKAEESMIRLEQRMPKDKNLILLIKNISTNKMLLKINDQVVDTINREIKSTLQTQAKIIKTNDKGQWTTLVLMPYNLKTVPAKQFANLNEMIKIERDHKDLKFTFVNKPKDDIAILKSFFTALPLKKQSTFDSKVKVKPGDSWMPDRNEMVKLFNAKHQSLHLEEDGDVFSVMTYKKLDEKHKTISGSTVYKGFVTKDERLSKMSPTAAFGTLNIEVKFILDFHEY